MQFSFSRTICVTLILANGLLFAFLLAQPKSPEAVSVAPLRLVSEHPIQLVSELPPIEKQLICKIWGPEPEQDGLLELQRQLKLAGVEGEIVRRSEKLESRYQVLLGNFRDFGAARRAKTVLIEHDIDTYIFSDEQIMVSAGVFSRRERALSMQNQVLDLGFSAETRELARQRPSYHLRAMIPRRSEWDTAENSPCLTFAQTL